MVQEFKNPGQVKTQDYLYKLDIINAIFIIFAQNVRPILPEV